MGRFAPFLMLAGLAGPALATTPLEPAKPVLGVATDFDLVAGAAEERAEPRSVRREAPVYPTEQLRVPVNDALRPPQLLWNPTSASLVKVVPAKVRYKLKF